MHQSAGEQFVSENIRCTPQQFVVAKAYLARNVVSTNPIELIKGFLREMHFDCPREIVSNAETDPTPALKQLVEWVSWRASSTEAIWSLIYGGSFIIDGGGWVQDEPNVQWIEGYPHNGSRESLRLGEYKITLPGVLRAARVHPRHSLLSDPDLFLQDLLISNFHEEVADALSECIRCFRHELYLASVVLLGKAAEGTWIEAGLALARLFNAKKLETVCKDPRASFAKKIHEVHVWAKSHETEIQERCGIRFYEFESAAFWADLVRDSRNAIHHGKAAATENSYEKVATLLIGSAAPFRTLYKMINAS